MGLIDELARFRVIDAHAHNWSHFADTDYLRACLDRFSLRGIVILSNLTGGFDPSPEEVSKSNEDTARLRDAVGERILPFCYVNAAHTEHACKPRWSAGAMPVFAHSSFGFLSAGPTSAHAR